MVDIQGSETPIMSIEDFKIGLLHKEDIPGLLIRCDENGYYNIGIQINDNEVVKVASAVEDGVMKEIQYWKDKVEAVRGQYKDRKKNGG